MKLRLGFSDTLLADPATRDVLDGIGVYSRALRMRLAADPGVDLVPVVWGTRAAQGAAAGTVVLPQEAAVAAVRSLLTGSATRGADALERRVDVYLATDYRIPKLSRTPVCATVHDAIPLSHPHWASPRMRRSKNWALRGTMRWADHVIAISQAMVPEIVEHYGIAAGRISVVPNGVDASWFVAEEPARIAEVRARHAIAQRYFLVVGTLQPRKNIVRVVDAYLSLPSQVRSEHGLVVVGREGWRARDIVAKLRGHAGAGVRWLERVDDADMRSLYQGSTAFVFASLYEGFGLPILEAFASSTLVIASNVTSLPEIAGDAACLVDPRDVDALAAAMARSVEDAGWAADLRRRGRERARGFTWEACARATTEVLRGVVARGRS